MFALEEGYFLMSLALLGEALRDLPPSICPHACISPPRYYTDEGPY